MSAIRDVRLLIARHLDLPSAIRSAVLNVLNVLDSALEVEGWEESDEVKSALRMLDHAVLDMDDVDEMDEEGLVDIDDINTLDEDDEDEDDEDA
jgi:hypothetical protein